MLMVFVSNLIGASIDAQIEAIKNAPQEERVELMNRLKVQIASMNEEERTNAIEALQKTKNGNKLQLRLHQGSGQEGSIGNQKFRFHNTASPSPKQQGKQ